MREGLTIGELARESGIPPKTIRYYESIGLIPRAPRTISRYRVYSNEDVRRLELIQRAKLFGMSLSQIGELVQRAGSEPCNTFRGHFLEMASAKSDEVDQKIKELVLLKDKLGQLEVSLSRAEKKEEQEDHTVMECTSCQCLGDQALR